MVCFMSDGQKYHLLKHHDKPSEKYLFPKQYLGGGVYKCRAAVTLYYPWLHTPRGIFLAVLIYTARCLHILHGIYYIPCGVYIYRAVYIIYTPRGVYIYRGIYCISRSIYYIPRGVYIYRAVSIYLSRYSYIPLGIYIHRAVFI